MRKTLILATSIGFLFPQNSLQASGLGCYQIQNAIQSNGTLILRYSSRKGGPVDRYDRFVANLDECPLSFNTLKARRIPTQDGRACPVHICWTHE
ncbi:hypothetical protein AB2N04_13660 [Nitratireductor sp. GISD-1A_MAKvit]|uniref:hypothetical protein n=1 Tax=Nitratireductor sp. GISD-1A_MAKvit TaxID=3234198 RepID=UPI003466F81E